MRECYLGGTKAHATSGSLQGVRVRLTVSSARAFAPLCFTDTAARIDAGEPASKALSSHPFTTAHPAMDA